MAEADIAPAYRTLCSHYARGCSLLVRNTVCMLATLRGEYDGIQAACCGKVYPCRLCHDEAEDHKMDRKQVATVQCRNCNELQEVKMPLFCSVKVQFLILMMYVVWAGSYSLKAYQILCGVGDE